ncbi:MAG: hypothetical protein AB1792_03170 [Candidatus Zixiibacteriota bacterium]
MIAERAVRYLNSEIRSRHRNVDLSRLQRDLAALAAAHPAMAVLQDLRETFGTSLRVKAKLSRKGLRDRLADNLCTWLQDTRHSRRALADVAAQIIPTRRPLLLLSQSGTVLAACRHMAHSRRVRVTICESRPAREGAIMARLLAGEGCEVTLVTDASAGRSIMQCGAVVLGADWVDRRGFVNKTGSLMLSMLAVTADVPVYVLADRFRIRHRILPDTRLPVHDPYQLLRRSTHRLMAVNRCFERVDWMPVHHWITECRHIPDPARHWTRM